MFQQTRDLFSELDLVFFDTTSIYFEGEGVLQADTSLTAAECALKYKELQARLTARGWQVEWQRLRDDLDALPARTCDFWPGSIQGNTFSATVDCEMNPAGQAGGIHFADRKSVLLPETTQD